MPKSDRWQVWKQSRLSGFMLFLWRRFNEVHVPQIAASLTYTSLLALVPILTVTLVIASAFPMFNDLSAAFIRFVNMMIVPSGAEAILNYIDLFKAKASNLTAIGLLFLFISSLMLVQTIDQSFNRIWNVTHSRPLWLQFLLYWALLTVGPLALGISISAWGLMLKSHPINDYSPLLADFIRLLTAWLFNSTIFWLLFRLVPNRYVPGRHALIGASLTASALEILRWGFTFYIGHFHGYELIYGAFAAIPVFLLWLHMLWMVVISGAVLTASLSYWQGEAFRRRIDAHGRFDDVLKILLLLQEAQQQSTALTVRQLRAHVNMGYDELGDLLEKLARYGYVYLGRQGWVLKTAPENIELDELFYLFVYRPPTGQADHVSTAMAKIMQPCLSAMDITLAEFSIHTEHPRHLLTAELSQTDHSE